MDVAQRARQVCKFVTLQILPKHDERSGSVSQSCYCNRAATVGPPGRPRARRASIRPAAPACSTLLPAAQSLHLFDANHLTLPN